MVMGLAGGIAAGTQLFNTMMDAGLKAGHKASDIKAAFDNLAGTGSGGARETSQNVNTTRAQTQYDLGDYADQLSASHERDANFMNNLTKDRALFNQVLNRENKQTNFKNQTALDDLANRANIAGNIINQYGAARAGNQRLMEGLMTAGITM